MKKLTKILASTLLCGTMIFGAVALSSCAVSENTNPDSLRSQKIEDADVRATAMSETITALNDRTNVSIKVFIKQSESDEVKNSAEIVVKMAPNGISVVGEALSDGKTEKVEEYVEFEKTEEGYNIYMYQKAENAWTKSLSVSVPDVASYLKSCEEIDGVVSMVDSLDLSTIVSGNKLFTYDDEEKGYVLGASLATASAKVVVKFADNKLVYIGSKATSGKTEVKLGMMVFGIGSTKVSFPKATVAE